MEFTFRLPHGIGAARLAPERTSLPVCDGRVTVPEIDGYAVIEIPYGEETGIRNKNV